MPKRLRQHVNPLKMSSLVGRGRLDLPLGVCTEVELGCADARFLRMRASAAAWRLHIGLDIREDFLREGHTEVQRLGLQNIRLEACNLIVDATSLFRKQCIRCFFINFPDPWFKRRQRRRRWLSQQTVSALVDALEEDGELFFQSDVWPLTIEALGLFEAEPRLSNTCGAWSFLRENPYAATSTRELICMRQGRKIWRLRFRKSTLVPSASLRGSG